jgi:hypothetical protein
MTQRFLALGFRRANFGDKSYIPAQIIGIATPAEARPQ